jgi:hypothetical protein
LVACNAKDNIEMTKRGQRTRKIKRLAAFFSLTLVVSLCFVVASMALVVHLSEPGVMAYQGSPEAPKITTPTLGPTATSTPEPTETPTPFPTDTLKPTATNSPTDTPSATVGTVIYGPEFPANIDPLTGLEASDPSLLERRPIAVKVVNYPRYVRPQAGLSLADIVYEYYLERGITRFIALYYGNDAEKVGPIRSGRFFDEHIFTMYQAYFVFGNADKRVMEHFMDLGRSVINRFVLEQPEDTKRSCRPGLYVPLCRDREIVSYNNMFTNTQALSEFMSGRGTDNSRQNLNGMIFSEGVAAAGAPGTSIGLDYSYFIYNRWQFDENRGKYLRFEETNDARSGQAREYAPLFDASTNQAISADNVVVLFVPHEYYVNTATTEIVKIHLINEGTAILFRDGKALPAFWTRPEGQGVLSLRTPEGEALPFKPGVTYFQVVGETSTFRQAEGSWEFKFGIP